MKGKEVRVKLIEVIFQSHLYVLVCMCFCNCTCMHVHSSKRCTLDMKFCVKNCTSHPQSDKTEDTNILTASSPGSQCIDTFGITSHLMVTYIIIRKQCELHLHYAHLMAKDSLQHTWWCLAFPLSAAQIATVGSQTCTFIVSQLIRQEGRSGSTLWGVKDSCLQNQLWYVAITSYQVSHNSM